MHMSSSFTQEIEKENIDFKIEKETKEVSSIGQYN